MKNPSRSILEVRLGVVLFFNRTTKLEDGWWWSSDANPFTESLQHGPFATSDEAVADASRDMGKFKLVRYNTAAIRSGKSYPPPTGRIIVVDTGGRLLVMTGERPAREGFAPLQ
jgi:hypothetical protein